MREEIEKRIESGQCAESALESVCDMFISIFSSADDDLTNQRATDVKDIKNGILRILLGREEADISAAPPGTVLVTAELTPSMTAGICKENIAGIITQTGSKTSHSAILARALEIPAVLSLEHAVDVLHNGDMVILDGDSGEVLQAPDPAQLADYTARQKAYLTEKKALKAFIGKQTATKDGCIVQLAANIGTPLDAQAAVDNDSEGIGLFRTEFLFMDQTALPTEEEQFEAYKKVALMMKGKPVVIRRNSIFGPPERGKSVFRLPGCAFLPKTYRYLQVAAARPAPGKRIWGYTDYGAACNPCRRTAPGQSAACPAERRTYRPECAV